MSRLSNYLTTISILLLLYAGAAQAQRDWTVQLKNPQVFIENQGQYDALAAGFPAQPRYVIDHGFGWQVMVTDQGLQYLIQRTERATEPAEEEFHEAGERFGEILQSKLTMQFVGASAARQLVATGEQADYYTFAYPFNGGYRDLPHVPSFAQLTLQGLYPGIDAVLDGPEDGGVKYSFRLAAGADPGAIRLRWLGATPSIDAAGDLHVPAVLGELVDRHPTAWYTDAPQSMIPARFDLQGTEVRFVLDAYDTQRAITIDPWTVNPALPAPFNRAFEVDCDAAGNVYVFGGGMGYNLKKYNAAGTLQWTHVSPWDTSNAWFGELLTMTTGDVFITSGSAAKIRRLTAAGATTFTNNGPFFNVDEYWTLIQNCDRTKLISGGTRIVGLTSPQGHVFDINMTNGNQMTGSPYNVSPVGMKEIRALSVGANGNYYLLSNDNVISLNQTFGIVYSIASGSSHPYNCPSYRAVNVQGQNIIDASANHVYTMNGATLERRNITTGAIINTVAIPGGGFTGGFFGTGATNGGLVIDNCSNVYVGSTNAVLKYDLALASLASVATTGAVYDVWVAPSGVVIWGGNGFLTSNTSLAPCAQKAISCIILGAELSYFKAECHLDVVNLTWQSLQENDLASYVVERTSDGINWEARGTVAGAGQSTSAITYTFQEQTVLPRADRPWFYRLKMVDANGAETYSGITDVETCAQSDPSISVHPTMAHDHAVLRFEAAAAGSGRLWIDQALGSNSTSIEVHWGVGQQAIDLPLSGLAAGLYHVRVTDATGTVIVRNARFVKQ